MKQNRRRHPSRKKIVLAQANIIQARKLNNEDAENYCWACFNGPIDKLIRAHIVPYGATQNDSPDNFFLLCDHCHRTQPDTASRFVQFEWLKRVESAWDRSARYLSIVMKSINDLCVELNDMSLMEKYASERLPKDKPLKDYIAEHKENFFSNKPKGGHVLNDVYSFHWFLLEDFLQWLQENNYNLPHNELYPLGTKV